MRTQKQQLSNAGEVGSVLFLSGFLSASIYVIDNLWHPSQHFSTLIAFGFAALRLIGLGLLWRERNAKSGGGGLTIVTSFMTTVGMAIFAGGLAQLDSISTDLEWILVYLVSPILALLGIAIILLRKRPVKEVPQISGGERTSERQ